MIVLTFNVVGTDLRRTDMNRLVAVSRNNVYAQFNFNSDWDDVTPKAAQFSKDDETCYDVFIEEGQCIVPWEVLESEGILTVTVAGGDLITTASVKINVYGSGLIGGLKPTTASPGVYSEIVKMADEISTDYNNIKSIMDTYEEKLAHSEDSINTVINDAKQDIAESEANTHENAVNAAASAEEAKEAAEDIKGRLDNMSFKVSSDDGGLDIIINDEEEGL